MNWEHQQGEGLLVLDVRMPGMNGLELQRLLADSGLAVPIIFISAHEETRAREEAMAAGVVAFLQKPFEDHTLLGAIHRVLGVQTRKEKSKEGIMKKYLSLPAICVAMTMAIAVLATGSLAMAADKPNILVIIADDVGMWNISAYHRGMMGGSTPNLDRIANEGALFTDYYSQQTCTAGRASFITGQHPYRVGLLKVGMPGAKQGMQAQDATIAELLKPHGYMTAQIGKNHLGTVTNICRRSTGSTSSTATSTT